MTKVATHPPGRFCWVELGTTDQAAAKKFYGTLFGWDAQDQPMGPGAYYTMFKKDGTDVAAGYTLRPEEQTLPPHWNLYVSVASADAAAAKAKELGATILAPPFDVMEAGRMAVLQDPTGAALCVWQAGKNAGLGVVDEPGAFSWGELLTRDTVKAAAFYTALFGWGTKADPVYTEWTTGGRSIGGMMAIEKEWGPVPPHWLAYFQVEDCDRSTDKAKGLGATVRLGPKDIPHVGRFTMLVDPQGATFYVIALTGEGH